MLELPPVGTVVANKYRIEALLAQGGMGAVFRARHQLMGKVVALKWLHPDLACDAEAVGRFLREARAAARIRHANVVEVHDVGVHDGSLYMVMELLEGETFERLLEREDVPIPQALRLLIGAMQGVSAVHKHGIVHRDIKPQNIFIVYNAAHPEGLAKVVDFGISKLNDDQHRDNQLTRTGFVVGTPMYMSLEQMNGEKDVDARADIYSFGVLLYRALTGKPPFDGNTFAALAVQVATHTPPSVKQLRPELPTSLDRLVMKAISRDRAQRHESIEHLMGELTLLASTEGFLGQMTLPHATPPVLTPKRVAEAEARTEAALETAPAAETATPSEDLPSPEENAPSVDPPSSGENAPSVDPPSREERALDLGDSLELSMRSLGRTTPRYTLLKWGAAVVLVGILWAALRASESAPLAEAKPKIQATPPSEPRTEPLLDVPPSAPSDGAPGLTPLGSAPAEPGDTAHTNSQREHRKERRPARQHAASEQALIPPAAEPADSAEPEPSATSAVEPTVSRENPAPQTAVGRRSGKLTRDDFR